MDPVSIIGNCLTIVKSIYDLRQEIKSDNEGCLNFFRRIDCLRAPLDELRGMKLGTLDSRVSSLQQISETLNNIDEILLKRVRNQKTVFGKLKNAADSYFGSFSACLDDLNVELDRCVAAVQLAVTVESGAVFHSDAHEILKQVALTVDSGAALRDNTLEIRRDTFSIKSDAIAIKNDVHTLSEKMSDHMSSSGKSASDLLEKTAAISEQLDRLQAALQQQSLGSSMDTQFVKDPVPEDEDDDCSVLGQGSFGVTHRMINTVDLGVYAVKQVKVKQALAAGLRLEDLSNESQTLQKLNHPHIVRYFTSFYNKKKTVFSMVMELIAGGSLADKITDVSVLLELKGKWLIQMASVLHYLHYEMRTQHRDIKPENVMLTLNSQRIKLIDLGTASVMRTMVNKMSKVGTIAYCSYEKAHGIPYDGRDDVWAAGCVFAELLTKSRLNDPINLFTNVVVDSRRRRLISDCVRVDAGLGSIIGRMLQPEQAKRCSSEELLELLISAKTQNLDDKSKVSENRGCSVVVNETRPADDARDKSIRQKIARLNEEARLSEEAKAAEGEKKSKWAEAKTTSVKQRTGEARMVGAVKTTEYQKADTSTEVGLTTAKREEEDHDVKPTVDQTGDSRLSGVAKKSKLVEQWQTRVLTPEKTVRLPEHRVEVSRLVAERQKIAEKAAVAEKAEAEKRQMAAEAKKQKVVEVQSQKAAAEKNAELFGRLANMKEVLCREIDKERFNCFCCSPIESRCAWSGTGPNILMIVLEDSLSNPSTITLPGVSISSICFFPDGSRLVVGLFPPSVVVVDIIGHVQFVTAVECLVDNSICTPDGMKIVSAQRNLGCVIIDAMSGSILSTHEWFTSIRMCFTKDGNTLAVGHHHRVTLVDKLTEKRRTPDICKFGFGKVRSLCISSCGDRLFAGLENGLVVLLNGATASIIMSFKAHEFSVDTICLNSSDSVLVSSSKLEQFKIWKVSTSDSIERIPACTDCVETVWFTRSDQIISSSYNRLKVWGN